MIHLSDVGGTGRETGHVVSSFGSLRRDQMAAEAEARRILGETRAPGMDCGTLGELKAGPFGAIMAEALGAFVAAPAPEGLR